MPQFEVIHAVRVDNHEGVSTSPWRELTAVNFPHESMPGTIGADYFDRYAALWKGRKRPVTIFQQPIAYLLVGYPYQDQKRDALVELERNQINTVADLMRLKMEALASFIHLDEVQERVGAYLTGLALTPHTKLLQEIYKQPQHVVPPDYEEHIVTAVDFKVDTLTARQKAVIRGVFGLDDGIIRDEGQMIFVRSRKREGVTIDEYDYSSSYALFNGLRNLQYVSDDGLDLRDYCSLPEESIGRLVFRGILYGDLPRIEGSFRDLGSIVSPHTYKELSERVLNQHRRADDWSLRGVAALDLSGRPFSPSAFREIAKALQDVATEQKLNREEKIRLGQELVAIFEARQQPTNRLLPTIPISADDVVRLSGIPLDDLDIGTNTRHVLRDSGVRTVAHIISLTIDQLRKLERLGKKGLAELASALQRILPLSPDEFPADTLEKLLVPPPPVPKHEVGALRVQENMAKRLRQAQAIITGAQSRGCSSADEIQRYLVENDMRLVQSYTPQDWITTALIEYVLKTYQENPAK